MFFFKIFWLLNLLYLYSGTIILKPIHSKGPEKGVIIFQGDKIKSINYLNFAQQLQRTSVSSRIWIAIAEFSSDSPNKYKTDDVMNEILEDFRKEGFVIKGDTPFYFIGHSVGGNILQDYLLSNDLPVYVSGMILEGSCIQRKNYDKLQASVIPSILTIGAELDGLIRITRIAESFYFDSMSRFPMKTETVVINGMNHYQFTGDNGKPPVNIENKDFKAEISTVNATMQLSEVVNAFINNDLATLKKYIDSTENLLRPIVEAFQLEGSYNYNLPCYQSSLNNCTYGSTWTVTSQKIMGTLNVSMNVRDQFFPAAQVFPDPLPEIFNKCTKPYNCILNTTTVSELIYSSKQMDDIVSEPQAAIEIRSKLSSRQNILLAATGVKEDFNVVDAGNLCGEINTESLKWGLSKAPAHVLARYNQKGRQLRIAADSDLSSYGPLWIWTKISYNDYTDDSDKRNYTEVIAPTMKFPVDYWISLTAGFHFCKVLSPARVIEWIYFDSLKM